MKKIHLVTLIAFLLMASCNRDRDSEWLIPEKEVRDGGPGKDGIPSVDNPEFINIDQVDFLSSSDLVVAIFKDDEIKVYPHPILDWHEIVNDEIADINYALTYCPLTGTAIAWNRTINNKTTTFGVSGKLYNSNLIPYDRETDSYWSQIGLNCVNGDLLGETIETFPVIETSWATLKKLWPQAKVMSTDTGSDRNYESYPYGDYRTNDNNIIFSVSPNDDRLPTKERVLAVLADGKDKVYSINEFDTPNIIFDNDLIVIGSKSDNFIVAFDDEGFFENLVIDFSELPIIATDNKGNKLDITGKVVEGPDMGMNLSQPNAFMGYFFSIGAFYPDIDIY